MSFMATTVHVISVHIVVVTIKIVTSIIVVSWDFIFFFFWGNKVIFYKRLPDLRLAPLGLATEGGTQEVETSTSQIYSAAQSKV